LILFNQEKIVDMMRTYTPYSSLWSYNYGGYNHLRFREFTLTSKHFFTKKQKNSKI